MCDVQCYDQAQWMVNRSPEVHVKVKTMGWARFTTCLAAKGSPRHAAAPPTMKPARVSTASAKTIRRSTLRSCMVGPRAPTRAKDSSHFIGRKKKRSLDTPARTMSVVCLLCRRDHGLGSSSVKETNCMRHNALLCQAKGSDKSVCEAKGSQTTQNETPMWA